MPTAKFLKPLTLSWCFHAKGICAKPQSARKGNLILGHQNSGLNRESKTAESCQNRGILSSDRATMHTVLLFSVENLISLSERRERAARYLLLRSCVFQPDLSNVGRSGSAIHPSLNSEAPLQLS